MKFRTFDQYLKRAQIMADGGIDLNDDFEEEGIMTDEEESGSDNEPNEQQKAFKEFLQAKAEEEA